MTIAALNWAFQQPITGPAKAVLIVLADHADQDGWCWPTLDRLAFRAGADERTARRAIRRLESEGFITVELGGGRTKTSRYHLCYQDGVNASDQTGSQRQGNGAQTGRPDPVSEPQKGVTLSRKGGHSVPKRGHSDPRTLRTTIEPRGGEAAAPPPLRARARARPPRRLTLSAQLDGIRRDWGLDSFLTLPPGLNDDDPRPTVLDAVPLQ